MKRLIVLAGMVLVLAGAAAQAHPGGAGGPGGPGGAGGPARGPGGEMGGPRGPRGGEQAGGGTTDGATDGTTDGATDGATEGERGGRRGPRGRGGHGGRGPAQALLRAADADDSKSVTADEFAAFLDGLITDENGAVDLADLATKLPAPREGFPEDADVLAEMLTRGFDVDGDGVVTKADLQAIFDKADQDDDGVVGGGNSGGGNGGGAGPDGERLRGRDLRCGKALIRAADADESKDVTADEWTAFLDSFAVDDAGAISLDDLAAVLPAPRGAAADDTEKRDAALLRAYDRDGDGVITRDDLQAVFDALDRNADGAIDRSDATRRAR